jgi:hypothetical protein
VCRALLDLGIYRDFAVIPHLGWRAGTWRNGVGRVVAGRKVVSGGRDDFDFYQDAQGPRVFDMHQGCFFGRTLGEKLKLSNSSVAAEDGEGV